MKSQFSILSGTTANLTTAEVGMEIPEGQQLAHKSLSVRFRTIGLQTALLIRDCLDFGYDKTTPLCLL